MYLHVSIRALFFERANITKVLKKKRAVKYLKCSKVKPEEANTKKSFGIYNIYGMKEKAVHFSKKVEGVFDFYPKSKSHIHR